MEFDMIFEDPAPTKAALPAAPPEPIGGRVRAATASSPRGSSHGQVPKVVNLEEKYGQSFSGKPTTLMIHNIPNLYSQQNLIEELALLGYGEAFDFLYVPLDMGSKCTVG